MFPPRYARGQAAAIPLFCPERRFFLVDAHATAGPNP